MECPGCEGKGLQIYDITKRCRLCGGKGILNNTYRKSVERFVKLLIFKMSLKKQC